MQNLKQLFIKSLALATGLAALAGCQTSPTFQNLPNPALETKSQNTLKIMWRIFTESKVGTLPIDPIPIQRITREFLDALDPQKNHIVRLGHSSHLLKLQGKYWLIDPVFSERASPVQWAGPKRFHASPIDLAQLPPIEGVIISHDHYDHLDANATTFLASHVERYVVPLKVGKRLVDMGVPQDRITELDWWATTSVGAIKLTATP
ncbi:MAG: hypothetical protein RLY82_1808, partial [Pseudomonadota bacterium]